MSISPTWQDRLLLGAAGAALMMTQYLAAREIGASFFSTELVLVGAVVVTLVGPSLAYALAHRLGPRLLAVWGALSVATHLALPFGVRAMVGTMAYHRVEAWALVVTVVCGMLLLCGFYAVFLPRCTRTPQSLPALYAAELAGAILGLLLLVLSPTHRVALAVYWSLAAAVLHLGLRRRLLTASVALAAVALTILYPRLDELAARRYYSGYWGVARPRMVETRHSPYHRVDVVDTDQ